MEPAGTSPTIFSSEPRTASEFAALVEPVAPGLSAVQIDQLLQYRDMLHARNQRVNLTAVRDFDGIERRLLLESLRLVPVMKGITPDNGNVMDLGSGGGIPGVILAIAMPGCSFTLLDATGKKVIFQRDVIESIGLQNVRAVQGRAEELGHDINWRNAFDAVSARAVTSLSALMELGLPFVSMKGWLVLPKGVEIDEELGIARKAAGKLGGTIVAYDVMEDAGTDVDTRLVLVRKDQPTPSEYPRRVGLPARSPLGSPQDQANAKGKQRKRGN